MTQTTSLTVGVLALQGGFHEHLTLLRRATAHFPSTTITTIEVRTPGELAQCDALIIPGGESTTISFVAAQSGLLEPLRDFVKFAASPPPFAYQDMNPPTLRVGLLRHKLKKGIPPLT